MNIYPCYFCEKKFPSHEVAVKHMVECGLDSQPNVARRDKVNYRYDILYWNFIHSMAEIAHLGAEKYGDFNYRQPGLTRDKSPVNHIANHLRRYLENESYDHHFLGIEKKWHLVAIAFNAMMEFWHEEHPPESQ